jgi:hypothetical protein
MMSVDDEMGTQLDLTTLLETRTEFEARAAAVVLEDAGIPSMVIVPSIQSCVLGAGGVIGTVRLQVRARDLKRAQQALAAAREESASVDWDSVDIGPEDDPEVRHAARGAPGAAALRPIARIGMWCALALVLAGILLPLIGAIRAALVKGAGALALVAVLSGCGYHLSGRVVEGGFDSVDMLPRSQAEDVGGAPVAGASIELYRDPQSPKRRLVGTARTDDRGDFTIVLQDFGAGWMEERWLVRIRRNGFRGAEQSVELPMSPDGWRMVGTLTRGRAVPFSEPESGSSLRRQADSFSGPGAFPR